MTTPHTLAAALFAASALLAPSRTLALDKQGSAHGGRVQGNDTGFGVSGGVSAGVALYSPTFAARPDNTGRVLMRDTAHLDVDLIGRRLSVPLDANVFSDRKQSGAKQLVPSELDLIAGLTSTFALGPGSLELGMRFEHDRQVSGASEAERADNAGVACHFGGYCSQSYVDARARYLYALRACPALGVTGYATWGWFVVNRSYAARPDNSGLALFRYALHEGVALLGGRFGVELDATFFTDRQEQPLLPSELDLTPELVLRAEPFDFHLAYERDMPLSKHADDELSVAASQRGISQSLLLFQAGFSFELGAR